MFQVDKGKLATTVIYEASWDEFKLTNFWYKFIRPTYFLLFKLFDSILKVQFKN